MKKLIYLTAIFFIFLFNNSFAQSPLDTANTWPQNADERLEDINKVYTKVDQMPSFPGGEEKLQNFLLENIKYPAEALKDKISGRVYISFVVDQTGKVRETKVLRGIGGGCTEEALRVIGLMPDWIPGKQNGKTVNVQYVLPISFNL